jgi:hypothetical protein
MVEDPAIATPADQPPALVGCPPRALELERADRSLSPKGQDVAVRPLLRLPQKIVKRVSLQFEVVGFLPLIHHQRDPASGDVVHRADQLLRLDVL